MLDGLVVCVNGFGDERLLLPALAESVRPLGCPVLYVDGAWELFLEPGEPHDGDAEAVAAAFRGMDLWVVGAPGRPWSSDAEKKTAGFRAARERGSWCLWLDTDDRVELGPGGASALAEAWAERGGDVGLVNIWRPDQPWARDGLWYPRAFPLDAPLHLRPPRDWDVWRGGERAAWPEMDGAAPPGAAARVPAGVLRLRHDRAARPKESLDRTGRYYLRRKARHGAAVV